MNPPRLERGLASPQIEDHPLSELSVPASTERVALVRCRAAEAAEELVGLSSPVEDLEPPGPQNAGVAPFVVLLLL